MEHINAKLIK